jgi:aspartyl-tRNA(Asn)/glutamyl-tRNA(Gln) amidotransferase subunit C
MPGTKITIDEVRHVAKLARLTLDEPSLETMRDQLSGILDYVAALDELDVSGVLPTSHAIEMTCPLREDVVRDSLSRAEILRSAPKSEAGGFAVPKVMEGE